MIISISGAKGSGKDTLGYILQLLLHFPNMDDETIVKNIEKKKEFVFHIFQIQKWAAKPNEVFKDLTGIDYSNLPREEKENVRPNFINFADNHMKACFGEDIWVKNLMKNYIPKNKFLHEMSKRDIATMLEETMQYPNWIITDTRLAIEAEAIAYHDNIMIKIEGPEDNKDSHRTETEFLSFNYDFEIFNTKESYLSLIADARLILTVENLL